jgi:hypothetical protein
MLTRQLSNRTRVLGQRPLKNERFRTKGDKAEMSDNKKISRFGQEQTVPTVEHGTN